MPYISMDDLLRQYGPLMRYLIAPILSDPRDREECLADAALRIWNQMDKFDPHKGSFTTWITVIVRNTALNHARGQKIETEELPLHMEAPDSDPQELLLAKERQRQLRAALDALSKADQTLFYRKYYYRQSTAQIASETGLSLRAVEGRLYRIKKQLRKKLGGALYD